MKHLTWLPMLALGASLATHAYAADPNKVLRVSFAVAETGFDPAKVNDVYSLGVTENIFDTLLRYDYLARPLKVKPGTAAAMPEVSADGKAYTIKIKPGIYFADDPAFKGKKRELTAADYAYSFKRFADPVVNSPVANMMTDWIAGLEDAGKRASKNGKFDYEAPISGIQVLDRYTLRLTLVKPNYIFNYTLAAKQFGAVAREVIEAYGKDTMSHPVGTGPFMLKEWKPGNKIVLVANQNYRKEVFDGEPGDNPEDQKIAKELAGKTLPQVGRVEVRIIEEEQPRWLSFLNKQQDWTVLPKSAVKTALHVDSANPKVTTLNPALAKRGIQLSHTQALDVTYAYFNMLDPVVGGYGKDKIALRRAIALAYPVEKEVIPLLYANQAIPMQNFVTQGIPGSSPNFEGRQKFDPALGNALLDQFGYKIGPDGYRTLPNGKPLLIVQATQPSALDKQFNQVWQKTFESLKIRVQFKAAKWSENLKNAYAHKLQMWSLGGSASMPDGDDSMVELWSKSIPSGSNLAAFSRPEFDRAFEESRLLPDGPEREAKFEKMNRVIAAYQPIVHSVTRMYNELTQSYVSGFKRHPIYSIGGFWRYVDVDKR
ncbi:ABC transporter substrate-binding protein [Chromobacterium sp. IIBBL 290-4]|uniref:ABC transporter substrate-binding protein n=1 Tax=Chromobacterium sp. IIBBL 290-4 TaxID=2953890 RepID=UPI0020B69664|nr:ABC transporter substrate-binding protein [Chromobacterium sp. IIBBL 290-4]UTH73431.1 ABC transporter substrate-binding protein [Chromobacterium sp. IIBBL 290-4]